MILNEQIALPLSIIFQKSYDSGEVPADWKKANVSVTPIFKKGKKSLASNHQMKWFVQFNPGYPVSVSYSRDRITWVKLYKPYVRPHL